LATKKTVYGLELDGSKFLQVLKDIKSGYQDLQKIFASKLTVKIDQAQFADLKKTLSKGFSDLADDFEKSMARSTKQVTAQLRGLSSVIGDMADAAEARLGDGLSKGGQRGAKAIVDAVGKANAEIKTRFDDQVANTLAGWSSAFDKLSGLAKQRFQDIASSKGLGFALSDLVKSDDKGLFQSSLTRGNFTRTIAGAKGADQMAADLQSQFSTAITRKEAYYAQIGRLDNQFESASISKDHDYYAQLARNAQSSFSSAMSRKQSEYAELQKLDQNFQSAMLSRDKTYAAERAKLSGLDQQFRSASNARDGRIMSQLDREFQQENATKNKNEGWDKLVTAPNEVVDAHNKVAISLAGWGQWLAVNLVTYRIIRDTVREIESLISSFVKSGITFTQNQEKDLDSLRGVLSANFDIVDAQGKQVEGASRLAAIQEKSNSLLQDIRAAAKDTAFSTEDLIQAYEQIAEPAVTYKKNSTDILQLTLSAATAARSLGLNMKDAGTELANLLSGRGGTNKLATGIGISQNDINQLTTTFTTRGERSAALFDLIQERLNRFAAASSGADQSLTSVEHRFSLIIGELSAGTEAPFFAAFREFVQRAEAFLNSDTAKEFFAVLKGAGQGVLGALQQEGAGLTTGGASGLNAFVIGLGKMLELLVQVFGTIAQVAKGTVEWFGTNQLLVQSMAVLFGIIGGFQVLSSLSQMIQTAAAGSSLLGRAIQALVGWMLPATAATKELTVAEQALAAQSEAAGFGLKALGAGILTLAAPVALAGIVYFFTYLLEQLAHVIENAKLAKEGMDALKMGDLDTSTAKGRQQLSDGIAKGDLHGAAGGASLLTANASARFSALQSAWARIRSEFKLTSTDIAGGYGELIRKQQELDSSIAASKVPTQTEDLKKQSEHVKESADSLRDLASASSDASAEARRGNESVLRNAQVQLDKPSGQTSDDRFASEFEQTQALKRNELVKQVDSIRKDTEETKQFYSETQILLKDMSNATAHNAQFVPAPTSHVEEVKRPFVDTFQQDVNNFKEQQAVQAKQDELSVAKRDMLGDEAEQRSEQRELALTAYIEQQLETRRNNFAKWLTDNQKLSNDKRATPDEINKYLDSFANQEQTQRAQAQLTDLGVQISQQKRKDTFARLIQEYQTQITAKEDEIVGNIGAKAIAEFDKTFAKLAALRPGDQQQANDQASLLIRMSGMRPQIGARAQNEADVKASASTVQLLTHQETLLGQQFADNELSVNEYVRSLLRLQAAERAALTSEYAHLVQKRDDNTTSPEEIDQINARLADIQARLLLIDDLGAKARAAFTGWSTALGGFSSIARGLFGALDDGTSGVAHNFLSVLDTIGSIVSKTQEFLQLIQQIRTALAATKLMDATSSVSSASNAAGSAGSTGASGGMFGLSAGATMAIAAVGFAALNFAIIGFQQAVKIKTDDIKVALDMVTKAFKDGAISAGEALRQVEKVRDEEIRINSNTKSGRAALDNMLPQFQQQIDELEQSIAQIRKSFQDNLTQSNLGSGPFADFAKTLLDLQTQAKNYLDTFTKGTPEYDQAIKDISQLYQNSLKSAKENLNSQELGFESEAISAAQRVVDLSDQHDQLVQQADDLAYQREQLAQQQQQLAHDEAKSARDLEQQRVDKAQQILDLENQIADTIKKAADDEATVRQRGVLAATQTLAQQKATEISNIRNTASLQLDKDQQDLAKLSDWTDFNDQVEQTNEQFAQRTVELGRQSDALNRQQIQLQQQIKLNEIDYDNAIAIANAERAIYGLSFDRYALEVQRGQIDLAQAQTKVRQWQDVDALIQSIVQHGDGVVFNPPPGFPQIRVTIGDIVIDNSDNSQNSAAPAPTYPGGTPPLPPIEPPDVRSNYDTEFMRFNGPDFNLG
jgi:hypothetical protein